MDDIRSELPDKPRKYENVYYIRGGVVIYAGKVNELLAWLPDGSYKVTIRIPFTVAVDTIYFDRELWKWVILDPGEPITSK